jgi:hypothetical protein
MEHVTRYLYADGNIEYLVTVLNVLEFIINTYRNYILSFTQLVSYIEDYFTEHPFVLSGKGAVYINGANLGNSVKLKNKPFPG